MTDAGTQSFPQEGEGDTRAEAARWWSLIAPPIRPDDDELIAYERALVGAELGDGADVLLLGSTPELRDLAARRHLRLTGCDADAEFWRAMDLLRAHPGASDERFIHASWLEIPEELHFDAILGDGALNMLSWQEISRLVPRLRCLLRPGGIALQRVQSANPEHSEEALAQAFADYAGPRTGVDFLLAHHFLVESLRSARHPDLTNREFYEQIARRYLEVAEFEALRPHLRDRRNCYPDRGLLTELFEREFNVVDVVPCRGEGIWGTTHLYVMARREAPTP